MSLRANANERGNPEIMWIASELSLLAMTARFKLWFGHEPAVI